MERTLLVSGSDPAFGRTLVNRARELQFEAILARVPSHFSGSQSGKSESDTADGADQDDRSAGAAAEAAELAATDEAGGAEGGSSDLFWNPRSPISSRTVFLNAVEKLGRIDEAIIVCGPLGDSEGLHEMKPVHIESRVDSYVKGMLFLAREALSYFQTRGEGTVSFVLYLAGMEVLTPVDAAVVGAFRAAVSAIFTFYEKESVLVRGFEAGVDAEAEFTDYVLTHFTEKPHKSGGRWNRYTGKSGLFSFGR